MTIASSLRRMPIWAFVAICLVSSLVGFFVGGIFGAAISDLAGLPSAVIALTALAGTFTPPVWLIFFRSKGDASTEHPSSVSAFRENSQHPPRAVEQDPSEDSNSQVLRPEERSAKNTAYRIIDWWRIGKATMNYAIYLFASLIFAGGAPHLILSALAVGTILFVLWLIVHSIGIVFNPDRDELRYPSFILRRSIPLSGITDANAQVVVRSLMSTLANGIGSGPKSRPDKQYAVNLSGDFETRQVRFASRKRRDQFLSMIRRFAPQAHITRWTGRA